MCVEERMSPGSNHGASPLHATISSTWPQSSILLDDPLCGLC